MKLNVEISLFLIGIGVIYVGADQLSDDQAVEEDKEIFRNLLRPFRMEKLNLMWVKAQQVNKYKVHFHEFASSFFVTIFKTFAKII